MEAETKTIRNKNFSKPKNLIMIKDGNKNGKNQDRNL